MKIRKLIETYKSNGINGIVKKIINKVYMKEYLYITTISDYSNYIDDKFALVELDISILNKMLIDYPEEFEERKYNILKNRLIDINKITYVVLQGKEACGYFSVSHNDTEESCANIIINVSKDAIYLYDDYTFSKHRGKGVHKFSIFKRLNIGKSMEKKYAYVAIFANNIFSEKAYKSFGFKKVKIYRCFRFRNTKKSIEKVL